MSERATPARGAAGDRREPIAIVGIGCRLPGGVASPEQLWRLLSDGVDAIGPMPADRFDVELLYDERPATPGKIMTRWGGFLEHIDLFDADFFGISPREAERLDPQQRLLLEVACEALADAGIAPEGLRGGQAGVFVGMWLNEFESRLFADPSRLDLYMTTGSGRYTASGRISYFLDLMGPSITVDTACSSSLVAVHLACQSLWSGESPLALAGGANVIMQPHISIAYSQSRMLAPDGRCKFGDARADGYVRSDGAALVVLRRLSDAVAAGDPIYAVIRGSAVTNDGRSSGFLATPGQAGQEEMLRRAYAHAGVDPRHVHYVEAHGTGTRAGDPVELGALGAVVGAGRPAERPCLVGSIKTNIGHTEGAAGVAGVIKVALALKHRRIPASLHLRQPNPAIAWDDLRLAVCAEALPWPDDGLPATGGVSSFGIAGTNAHVVLQEAPPAPPAAPSEDRRAQLLAISAHTPAALAQLARAYRGLLVAGGPALSDICSSAGARRAHHAHRLAVVARDRDEAAAALAAFAGGDSHPAAQQGEAAAEPPRVVFVFPGQGSQWLGMARELLRDEPAFAAALRRCDEAIQREAGWSLLAELAAEEAVSRLGEIDVVQPTLFAIQVGLATLWRAWGVEPAAVVGHSMGEVAAAHVAGALSLEDAVAVICRRSRLLRRVRGQGAMAVVGLPVVDAHAAIAGLEDRIAVAVSNSPRSTVLSGDPAALDTVLGRLQARNIFCRMVKVDVASHSPQVEALLDDLLADLAAIEPRAASIPLCSTVSGELLTGEAARAALGPAYWLHNLRQPVRFADAVARLGAAGHSAFVEVSPHPILLGPVEETLQHHALAGLTLPSLQRGTPDRASMLNALGALYVRGLAPRWPALHPAGGAPVALPAYPWQRRRYWLATTAPSAAGLADADGSLLGQRLPDLALVPGARLWAGAIDPEAVHPALRHPVAGVELLSGAYYACQALQAAAAGGLAPRLRNLAVRRASLLTGRGTFAAQVALTPGPGGAEVQIFGRAGDAGPWEQHAAAQVVAASAGPPELAERDAAPRLPATPDRALPGLSELRIGEGEAWGRLALDEDRREPSEALALGAGLRMLLCLAEGAAAGELALAAIAEVARGDGAAPAWAVARLRPHGPGGLDGDVFVLDVGGRVVIAAAGVRLEAPGAELLERAAQARAGSWLYELAWRPIAPPPPARPARLLIFADGAGLGAGLARQLAEQGGEATLVTPGASFARLVDGSYSVDPASVEAMRRLLVEAAPAGGPWQAAVYLWGLGRDRGDALTADDLMERQRAAVGSALALAQALAREDGPGPRLWIVTRRAVAAGEGHVAAEQATLWGLGRVLANEHPERWGGLIDLDDDAGDSAARRLLGALSAGDGEDQVALRGDGRLAARLVRASYSPGAPALRPDATYLITGGLGGVGLAVGRWMLANGARSLALIGRRPPGEAADAALRGLEQDGARVVYLQADVAQPDALAAALATIAATMPPLRGLVHAAGALDDAALLSQSWGHFERVMRSKVMGAWNLHQQTARLDLDMFVLCSSVSALIGTPGQANYAAANAFLDALAEARRAAGLAALSIGWGRWGEAGLATQQGRDRHLERRGLTAMAPASAAAALGRLRGHRRGHVALAEVNWAALIGSLPSSGATPLLAELAGDLGAHAQAAPATPDFVAALAQAPAEDRYERCLELVRRRVAAVLRFESADQVPPGRGFFQLGMDSLTALELRSQLGQSLGRTLSATLAMDYPTATGLARHLLAELFPDTPPAGGAAAPAPETLAALSRDDLKALLDAELDAINP